MAVINIEILNQQVSELLTYLSKPDQFLAKFHQILQAYHNWALRKEPSSSKPFIKNYHIPVQVFNKIERSVIEKVKESSSDFLPTAEKLWEDPFIESKTLASSMVGNLPMTYEIMIVNRIRSWMSSTNEAEFTNIIMERALSTLTKDKPHTCVSLVENLVSDKNAKIQELGLITMQWIIKDDNFQNVPIFFKYIRPLFPLKKKELLFPLINTLKVLLKRIPSETEYFLREILSTENSEYTESVVRRCIPYLDSQAQDEMRKIL